VVTPRSRRPIKVGIDGEVCRMRAPLKFSVASEPLWMLTPVHLPAEALPVDGAIA